LCCKYTTKGRSKFIEEIYTHFEAQMQLIFSKKTQNLIFVSREQQRVAIRLFYH